jgi:hypothetical protein
MVLRHGRATNKALGRRPLNAEVQNRSYGSPNRSSAMQFSTDKGTFISHGSYAWSRHE